MDLPRLAAVELLDANEDPDAEGELRPLGDFWQSGPCVLVFLRHFG